MAFEGAGFIETALHMQSSYEGVRKWVAVAEEHGLESLLKAQSGKNLDRLTAHASKLRRMATQTRDRKAGRRLLVLANVAAGMPVIEAAAQEGVSLSTVTNWVRCFIEQGAEGMTMRVSGPKLKDGELDQVRAILKGGPPEAPGKMGAWTAAALRAALRKELGFWYSHKGIRRLLKRLGFTWVKRGPGRGREPLGISAMKLRREP
jgi:transposase